MAEDARVSLAVAADRERDGCPLAAMSATGIAVAGGAMAVANALAAMAAAGVLAPADALAAGARMAANTVSAAAATASDAACLVIALGDRPSSEDGQNRGNHMAVSRDCKVFRFVGCPRAASALRLARAPRHPHPLARVDCVSHVKTSSRHQ